MTGDFQKARNQYPEKAFIAQEECAMNIPDELIRKRSYEIWQQAGCPHGLSLQHWYQAKAELESQFLRTERLTAIEGDYRQIVSPRPSISYPPRKLIARRLGQQDG